jgi:hypothetical protein
VSVSAGANFSSSFATPNPERPVAVVATPLIRQEQAHCRRAWRPDCESQAHLSRCGLLRYSVLQGTTLACARQRDGSSISCSFQTVVRPVRAIADRSCVHSGLGADDPRRKVEAGQRRGPAPDARRARRVLRPRHEATARSCVDGGGFPS